MYKIYRAPKKFGIGQAHHVTDEDGKMMLFFNEQDAQDYMEDEGLDESDFFESYILEVE